MKQVFVALISFIHFAMLSCIEILPYGPLASQIKKWILIRHGANVGKDPTIYSGVWIRPIRGLTIGDHVSIGKDVIITTAGTVTIGNNVLVGHGSKIISANHVVPEGRGQIRFAGHENKPVVIEDNVWIATQVVILPGVRIGEGAVVTAGAVVTKDVPQFVFVGGVPAQVIKYRLDPNESADKRGEKE